ncbi:gluconokinase [Algoriphagus machipongonensis]|uniref:Gluconokinase n=1 Tax=Algoriphagus machipongonensis TaxID=388413 RepID=A3HZ02_9BACT|nr:gluconokinase [Algoriphagus machipongonensis]EAZ80488.1 shikimate kinase [Algoriphagus machipongonensis]
MLIIVTGVSGTGKTTIGEGLSNHFKLPFFDADHFHPEKNIEKMSQGFPLDDQDRMPWLQALANKLLESQQSGGAVLACSALKEAYREILQVNQQVHWVHLKGDRDLIWDRMLARKNHYMKASMLDSQIATWEDPSYGLHLSIDETPEKMVSEAISYILKKEAAV